ncbi:MAG TPA: hypothetical protein VNU20_01440 [Candidatus Sulfotelmatobacter sp.]|jgi:hypothetical protein|nr:hypothetical protein [Candidatus Sulfotelmatobacter sp.]
MIEPLQLQAAAWALTTALELVLFALFLRRKLGRTYPAFFAYLLSVILQSLTVAALYRTPNLAKLTIWLIAWGTQGVVVLMRSLAIVELNRSVLRRYIGIWALARRLLVGVAVAVLAYDLALSKGNWQWLILNGIRGLELAMAAVIVTMLLFARYYRVQVNHLQRALAVGLCLYSAFYVINYSVLERIVQQYGVLWNFLGMFAFIASLLVWINGANQYAEAEEAAVPPAIPPELYGKLSSEVNSRLILLNRHLIQFLHVEHRSQ